MAGNANRVGKLFAGFGLRRAFCTRRGIVNALDTGADTANGHNARGHRSQLGLIGRYIAWLHQVIGRTYDGNEKYHQYANHKAHFFYKLRVGRVVHLAISKCGNQGAVHSSNASSNAQ